jgi:hypothetical protein
MALLFAEVRFISMRRRPFACFFFAMLDLSYDF